ncbi:MAG: NAD-dependent epimerase/dehydratase family protein [Micromonosporaceae bacterium]
MRILVLGGSVFLSRTVAQLAQQRGYDVTCACRGTSGTLPEGVRHVPLDRDDPDGFAALDGERFDAVVDVARRPSQVRRALAALSDRAAHWTFVSTCSVYADDATPGQRAGTSVLHEPAGPDADESDPELYGSLKVTCENLVAEFRGGDGFVVRAGLIGGPYDRSDRFAYWALRLARGGEVLAPGTPQDLVQVIDVRDLAEWLLEAAGGKLTGIFDAIGPPTPFGEFLERVAAGVGVTPELTWVDQEFLTEQQVEPWMGPRSLPMWLPLPEYAGFMTRDASPAYAAGLRCRDLAETARDTLAWEQADGRAHPISAGLTEAEETALLTAWHSRQP